MAELQLEAHSPFVEASVARTRVRQLSGVVESFLRFAAPVLLVAMLIWVWFPIVDLILMSVNTEPFSGIPSVHMTLDWYRRLASAGGVGAALVNSLETALIVAAVVAVASFFLTRAFRTMQRKALLLGAIVFPVVIPGLIFGFALLVYSGQLGVAPGAPVVIAAQLTWAFPFGFLAMVIAASRLDSRVLEAAADLGASRWQVVRDVELPILRPGVVAAFVFGFLLSFNELMRTIFVNGSFATLPVYVWAQESSHSSTAPFTYALSSIMALASIAAFGVGYWMLFRRSPETRLARGVG